MRSTVLIYLVQLLLNGGEDLISLNYRSGQPLYRQVKEGYKRLILIGAIEENERLPSVRELAAKLAINPNTIQRAYRELEVEGYVGSSPGKGVYAIGGDALREREIEVIYDSIHLEVKKLLDLGWELEEIQNKINVRFERN